MSSRDDRNEMGRPVGGLWDYVSPSRVNLWLKCPLAFRLRYVDGIWTPPSASQFVGRTVHRALEHHYRHRQQSIEISPAEVAQWLRSQWEQAVDSDGVCFNSAAAAQAARQQALDLVNTYLAQVPPDEPRPLAIESMLEAPLLDPVTGQDLGLPLVGIIDLVLPGPEGAVIADFKTTSRGGELLEITHELQLSAYSYLFRQKFPWPEEALEIRNLIKTKHPRVENHRFVRRTLAHYRRLFAIVRGYLDTLDSRKYGIRPSHLCAACEFARSHCAQWVG
jgi:hypothetical protein